jgi:hypothetical protein
MRGFLFVHCWVQFHFFHFFLFEEGKEGRNRGKKGRGARRELLLKEEDEQGKKEIALRDREKGDTRL